MQYTNLSKIGVGHDQTGDELTLRGDGEIVTVLRFITRAAECEFVKPNTFLG